MEPKSMTALVSAFARWYHAERNLVKIFDDNVAGSILSEGEKEQIAAGMSGGIGFFNPGFAGTREEALRWVVDRQLSPSPLGRAAWAERALRTAVRLGAAQYVMVAAGYDTFAHRQPGWARPLRIFELDHPAMSEDKQRRVRGLAGEQPGNLTYIDLDLATESLPERLPFCAAFDKNAVSFYSLLGISYYLSPENFKTLLRDIANLSPIGSTVVFDYPDEDAYTERAGERAKRQAMMARGAGEAMLASYAYADMERWLADCGLLIYEHLTPREITEQYFAAYNQANPRHAMTAFDNVNYCLAVRK